MQNEFDRILAEAVEELMATGFDSMERVEAWTRKLREAARRVLISPEKLDELLREKLASIYRRMVERDGILKFNQGVERFTYQRIKPKLRAELDRRIMASANLIRLNRDEAIEKTLKRFQGWSTSLPKGGVSRETKAEVKANVRKAVRSLPFEERRVLVDQGHKLVAAINDVIAVDGGAIAARWRSNYRQPGYDYREDHRERDDKIYLIRGTWAQRAGLVKPGRVGYSDTITQPGEEVFCRCYFVFLYNLDDLPTDMLTAKGKAALASAHGREEVYAARTGRADAVEKATKAEARYVDGGQPRPKGLQCNLCNMFRAPRFCSAVLGDISPAGYCSFFEFNERMARRENTMALKTSFAVAEKLDKLGYLKGCRHVVRAGNADQWNASYDDERDQISIEDKLERRDPVEQVRILLHEAGHRGQFRQDVTAFNEFMRRGLATTENFLAMANPTHVRDYDATGKIDDLSGEVFAESYSRACLGMPMPTAIREFWEPRLETARAAA